MGIFKAYDVRGVYPSDLNEEIANRLGRAIVVLLDCRNVLVGRDCRQSSPALTKSVMDGITDQGADVLDIGLASSPMFSFCAGSLNVDGGVMVTASHNPPEYNGFKLCKKNAVYMSGESGIKEIEALVANNDFPASKSKGKVTKKGMLKLYVDHVLSFARDSKPMRVVVDAGNGMCGMICEPVFAGLPGTMIPLFFELDGKFPNRSPNPMEKANLSVLISKIKKEGADVGIAFDPDGDRVTFIDENGEFIPSDLSTALIAKEVAFRESKPIVLFDLRSSRAVKESLDADGIASIKTRVGHAFIKASMREHNAAFAGELSGHFYFRDHYFCDSGLIASMFMLSLLSRTGKSLSSLVKPLRKYVSTGEVNFKVPNTKDVLDGVQSHFKGARIDLLDGVSVSFPDWWVSVRESNTEPVVRMIIEASTTALLEKERAEIEGIIKTCGGRPQG